MNDDERLREALLELELLRGREAQRLRETSALVDALEAMAIAADVDDGISELLGSVETALGCDTVVLFAETVGGMQQAFRSDGASATASWSAPGLLTRPRRMVDLTKVSGLWQPLPPDLADMQSLLSAPFGADGARMVLVAFSRDIGKFTADDAALLNRMAAVANQAIVRKDLESRTSFLAAVIDDSPVSVAIAEATDEMPLIYVNEAFEQLTGYDQNDILGQNCRMLSAEDPDSSVRNAIRGIVETRGTGTFTLRNRKKSGEVFWNELRLFPVLGGDGAVTHMVATQTDATQRMQAELDRDEARRRLEGALAATTDAFLILGKGGHVRFANAPFERMLKPITVEQGAGLSSEALDFLLAREVSFDAENPMAAFSRPLNHEVTNAAGRVFIVRAREMPDGGAVITATDVTQIKVNDRILQQRLAAIERSQDGVAIGDREGRLLDINPSLLSLWGLTSNADALGRKWTHFYDASVTEAFENNQEWFEQSGVWRGEAEITRGDRVALHDVSLSLVPEIGSVLIVRDVTERRRNTEERAALRRRLDRAQMQERLHQVSAGLAHDFNNLLSVILGSASVIDASDNLNEATRSAVKRIQQAANRAAELTDGFLDLGAREKSSEMLEVGTVLCNTVDLVRGSVPSSVEVSASLKDTPLMLQASQTDLLQVVMNLVVNGVDAHEGSPGDVRVSVSRSIPTAGRFLTDAPNPDRDYAAIVVEDTGKGMSEDTLQNVMKPYFTTKGNTGTGLGLAVIGSILSENAAALEIETEVGHGTRFTVWWPLMQSQATRSAKQPAVGPARMDLPILVLDDVPDVAAAIAADLTSVGYEVAETHSPEIAIETIEEDPGSWGCLITDYDMPEMTGGALITHLSRTAPDLPVIVVSALARRLTDKALANAIAVLQKPVDKDKLLAAVRQATTKSTRPEATE